MNNLPVNTTKHIFVLFSARP